MLRARTGKSGSTTPASSIIDIGDLPDGWSTKGATPSGIIDVGELPDDWSTKGATPSGIEDPSNPVSSAVGSVESLDDWDWDYARDLGEIPPFYINR